MGDVLSRGRTKFIFVKLSKRLLNRKSATYIAFMYLYVYAFRCYTYIPIRPRIKSTAQGALEIQIHSASLQSAGYLPGTGHGEG